VQQRLQLDGVDVGLVVPLVAGVDVLLHGLALDGRTAGESDRRRGDEAGGTGQDCGGCSLGEAGRWARLPEGSAGALWDQPLNGPNNET
jgi:hypothetical protein